MLHVTCLSGYSVLCVPCVFCSSAPALTKLKQRSAGPSLCVQFCLCKDLCIFAQAGMLSSAQCLKTLSQSCMPCLQDSLQPVNASVRSTAQSISRFLQNKPNLDIAIPGNRGAESWLLTTYLDDVSKGICVACLTKTCACLSCFGCLCCVLDGIASSVSMFVLPLLQASQTIAWTF